MKRQGFKVHEIIVVDNASDDDTIRIARRYARVVYEPRKGVSRARNTGAAHASGEILFFMDADTRVLEGTLRGVARAFEDPNTVIATGPIAPVEKVTRPMRMIYRFSFNFLVKASIAIHRPYFIGSSIAIRKETFTKMGGFNENLKTCEDGDFSNRASRYGEAVFSEGIRVKTSARRLIEWGSVRYLTYNAMNVLDFLVFKRTRDKNYNFR